MFTRQFSHQNGALAVSSLMGYLGFRCNEEPQSLSCRLTALSSNEEYHVVEHSTFSRLSPISPLRIFRPNPHLEICYDTRTRNAVYVQHRIVVDENVSSDTSVKRQRLRFKEEAMIPENYRSRNSHYHKSGYDRGHLAPAADFPAASQFLQDTYNLTNVSPQNSDMNRKIWAWLEEWTRGVARRAHCQHTRAVTYATTGPLWLPTHQVAEKAFRYSFNGIGTPPTLVRVPTHFFKVVVVVDESNDKILNFACFVIPNHESANLKTLHDYMVSWSDLETVTGLVFFPGLADETFKAKADWLTQCGMPSNTGTKLLSSGATTKRVVKRSHQQLRHLCDNQACVPRKQQNR